MLFFFPSSIPVNNAQNRLVQPIHDRYSRYLNWYKTLAFRYRYMYQYCTYRLVRPTLVRYRPPCFKATKKETKLVPFGQPLIQLDKASNSFLYEKTNETCLSLVRLFIKSSYAIKPNLMACLEVQSGGRVKWSRREESSGEESKGEWFPFTLFGCF